MPHAVILGMFMTVTPQRISRILEMAGHKRGFVSRSGRVVGWSSTHEGFEVVREYASQWKECQGSTLAAILGA